MQSITDPNASELVLAFVGPIGVRAATYVDAAIGRLRAFSYEGVWIRLSELLPELRQHGLLKTNMVAAPEYDRIVSYMDAGDELRSLDMPGARGLLASAALAKISGKRGKIGDPKRITPRPRTLWLLDSLKNPAEVEVLRRVYGPGFFLVGLFASELERKKDLKKKGLSDRQVDQLVERDTGGSKDHGQQTRKTFELADVWIRSVDDLTRFIDLVFGDVSQTPTIDENSMATAYTAALRSSSLSRQVGAAIVASKGDIVATGCNEVPAPGGGQYFPPTDARPSARDFESGEDSNTKERIKIQREIADGIQGDVARTIGEFATVVLNSPDGSALAAKLDDVRRELDATVARHLEKSGLRDITEYGRAVHAEMSALMSAARLGVSVQGATLYCTTFPCHNCAKHIVAAGIKRVVFVEPYPKSKAKDLHADSIDLIGEESKDSRLADLTKAISSERTCFEPFIGVGPRRYLDLFSLNLGTGRPVQRKNGQGDALKFNVATAVPRVLLPATDYLDEELEAISLLDAAVQGKKGLSHEQ